MHARSITLLAALALSLALLLFSRTQRGAAALASGVDAVVSSARGLRNNNPGNIREAKGDLTQWIGERATDDDPAFEEFDSMTYGVRAAAVLFHNYQRLHGLNTVRQIISRWAPPSENDTAAYIASVAKRLQTTADTHLDLHEGDTLHTLLRAVFRHENGIAAEAIPDAIINEGIRLA